MGVQGRRTSPAMIQRIIDLRARGVSWRATARACDVSTQVVHRYAPRAVVEARRAEMREEAARRGAAFLLVLSGRRDRRERERDRLAGEGMEPNASPSPPTTPAPPASQAKPTAESTAHPWRKFAK